MSTHLQCFVGGIWRIVLKSSGRVVRQGAVEHLKERATCWHAVAEVTTYDAVFDLCTSEDIVMHHLQIIITIMIILIIIDLIHRALIWAETSIGTSSRSPSVSAETTERDPMAWRWYCGSRGAVPRGMWRLLTHWQHPTCRKMRYRQEVLQWPCRRERRPSTVCFLLLTFFLVAVETLGPFRDSWSLVRRGSQPHCRNQQKSHALHSQSAVNYVPVPTYFSGNSAFQCSVPCQHAHSFRVHVVTIPDIHVIN